MTTDSTVTWSSEEIATLSERLAAFIEALTPRERALLLTVLEQVGRTAGEDVSGYRTATNQASLAFTMHKLLQTMIGINPKR